jgi:hypothetical protein
MRTETQTLHDDALAGEAGISVKLHTHGLVAEHAVVRGGLEQGVLLRTSLPKRDRADSLEVGWIREQGDLDWVGALVYETWRGR